MPLRNHLYSNVFPEIVNFSSEVEFSDFRKGVRSKSPPFFVHNDEEDEFNKCLWGTNSSFSTVFPKIENIGPEVELSNFRKKHKEPPLFFVHVDDKDEFNEFSPRNQASVHADGLS